MNRLGRYLTFIFIFVALNGCATHSEQGVYDSWHLVFENDAHGNMLSGSKQRLIDAVRAGKPVRIYTAGRRIEHSGGVSYLSIFKGEVFAQIMEIQSQRPAEDPVRIEFRKPGEKWRAIIGTNGFVTAYIDGREPNKRTGASRWYVQH